MSLSLLLVYCLLGLQIAISFSDSVKPHSEKTTVTPLAKLFPENTGGYELVQPPQKSKPVKPAQDFTPIKAMQHHPNAIIMTSRINQTTAIVAATPVPPVRLVVPPNSHPSHIVGGSVISAGLEAIAGPMRILAHPLRNLVMMSFEGYRQLLVDAHRIEDAIRERLSLSKRMRFRSLDPIDMPSPVVIEHRDKNSPVLGKVVLTLSDVMISGLSQFRVDQLDGSGRNLFFRHIIPRLDSVANYTIDYHLFDAIPFRVSEGHLIASVPNAQVRGSFQIFPDFLNAWFRVAQLNLSTVIDDLDLRLFPRYVINDKFTVEKSTEDKIQTAIQSLIPNITEMMKITYSRAIELKLTK